MMISAIINLVVTAIILRYVIELEQENCECSLDWQHQFIKYFAPVVILVSLIILVVSKKTMLQRIRNSKAFGALYLAYLLAALFYSIVLVLYFLKLRYSKCKCARDWKQYGLLYPLIGFAVILLVAVLFTIISVFGLIPDLFKKLRKGKGSKTTPVSASNSLLENINDNLSSKPSVKSSSKSASSKSSRSSIKSSSKSASAKSK